MLKKIFAHRGASAYVPENTLPAFEKAVDIGADGVELDIHLSRDGRLVVSRKNIAISNLERSLCLRLWESISTPATNSIIPVMQNRVTYHFIMISQFPCKYRVYFIS